jgi:hypothetical protein
MSDDSASKSEEFQVPCQPSGRSSHPIRTPICPLFHPSGQCVLPFGPPRQISIIRPDDMIIPSGRYTVSRRVYLACIRPDVSAARPDAILYREGSIRLAFIRTFQQHVRTPLSTRSVFDFFPSSKKGKINQSSRRCGIPSGCASP